MPTSSFVVDCEVEKVVKARGKAFAFAHKIDEKRQAHIAASRHASSVVAVVVWSGSQTQFGRAQIKARAKGLSFYHPELLRCPD